MNKFYHLREFIVLCYHNQTQAIISVCVEEKSDKVHSIDLILQGALTFRTCLGMSVGSNLVASCKSKLIKCLTLKNCLNTRIPECIVSPSHLPTRGHQTSCFFIESTRWVDYMVIYVYPSSQKAGNGKPTFKIFEDSKET